MHKIIQSDIYAGLLSLENNSIDVAITSPPYWAQRNYGFEKQIGSEKTYMEFISRLVFLFNVLRDKLSEKGVFFLNIGDKYLNKYGKTPLGLIPFKLAYFMEREGWFLNDTIIWHKPNRMPSSVKNRFVNSYEPVFVFSKKKGNYFSEFVKNNPKYSNVIDVNLQPTPYKHVAVYPEKLVDKLLDFVSIEHDYTVLDPFAGSGTTLKTVVDRNSRLLSKNFAKGVMIEYNPDYVDIIFDRLKNTEIEKVILDEIEYEYPILKEKEFDFNTENKGLEKNEIKTVNIFSKKEDFYKSLKTISSQDFLSEFKKNQILFIGLKNFNLEDIYNISLLKNWIIRNQLVVRGNRWFPIFMLVHDNKIYKYNFNYKLLRLKHKSESNNNYRNKNFIGYSVKNSLQGKTLSGVVVDVLEKYSNGFPKYVEVLWDNDTITAEFVIDDEEKINDNVRLVSNDEFYSIIELEEIVVNREVNSEIKNLDFTNTKLDVKSYNGKFSELERKNWGASPGARSSVVGEFFSMQRLYNVNQNMIADYLNYIRKKHNLTKQEFTNLFPDEFKYKVGHWLRKDFGGSVPVKEDWEVIEKLFEIDKSIKEYASKTALKLQTVAMQKFKIPDDVIDPEMIKYLELLNKEEPGIKMIKKKPLSASVNFS